MSFRLPWVSREQHEELVAELRSQIAELKAETHKYEDLFILRATGEKVHNPDPEPEAIREPVDYAQDERNRAASALRQQGKKVNARNILSYLEQEATQAFNRQRGANPAPAIEALPEDMQEAVNQGRAAVEKS